MTSTNRADIQVTTVAVASLRGRRFMSWRSRVYKVEVSELTVSSSTRSEVRRAKVMMLKSSTAKGVQLGNSDEQDGHQ